MDENQKAREAARDGRYTPVTNTNWGAVQQGQIDRQRLEEARNRPLQPKSPGADLSFQSPQPAGGGGVHAGDTGEVVGLLWLVVVLVAVVTLPVVFTALYPLAVAVTVLSWTVAALIMESLLGPLGAWVAIVPALVVLFLTSRLEHRLGQKAVYRVPRHLVRLLPFGAAAAVAYSLFNGIPLPQRFADVPGWIVIDIAVVPVIGIAMLAGHFLLWKGQRIRDPWHGLLEAIRLKG